MQRMNDPNTGGGKITSIPQGTVYANNRLVAVNGSKGTGHGTGRHRTGAWKTQNGSSTVYVNSIPVNRDGDTDDCGHSRISGSSNVFVGG